MKKNIKLHIRNVNNPNFLGTNICDNGHKNIDVIKSIAYSKDISLIKIHGHDVGQKPGVLLEIV